MKLSDIINKEYLDAKSLSYKFNNITPFPHIVFTNFINRQLLEMVSSEFPDLKKIREKTIRYDNNNEIKFASKGIEIFSPSAIKLNNYLQSELMLNWLKDLTQIKEDLISDPYLAGGGYHEIKTGGFLKIHADFNKHPKLNLDRRLNLLIYLNKNWNNEWGGALQLYDKNIDIPKKTIFPKFNTAVIFTTTSYSYHGHPEELKCPRNHSRRSLAYYYYSTGRPEHEMTHTKHSTIFKRKKNEKIKYYFNLRNVIKDITPPIIIKIIKNFFKKN